MVSFDSTKLNCTLEEWKEALECIVELNGKSFDIPDLEIAAAYDDFKAVDEFYYDEWEPEEDDE